MFLFHTSRRMSDRTKKAVKYRDDNNPTPMYSGYHIWEQSSRSTFKYFQLRMQNLNYIGTNCVGDTRQIALQ